MGRTGRLARPAAPAVRYRMVEQPPETPRTRRAPSRRQLLGGMAVVAAAGTAGALLGIESVHRPRAGQSSTGGPRATATARPPAIPDDPRVRIQHLLRRAGFAPSEEEVQHGLQIG